MGKSKFPFEIKQGKSYGIGFRRKDERLSELIIKHLSGLSRFVSKIAGYSKDNVPFFLR